MEWIVIRRGNVENSYQADEIVSQLNKQKLRTIVRNDFSSEDIQKLQSLKQHIDQSFLQEHTLRSLCRYAGLNEFKLKKGFRKLFDTGAIEYVRFLRMEYAKSLLLNSSLRVRDVSMQVGYRYPHHFSTAYKKHFGMQPTAGTCASRPLMK